MCNISQQYCYMQYVSNIVTCNISQLYCYVQYVSNVVTCNISQHTSCVRNLCHLTLFLKLVPVV